MDQNEALKNLREFANEAATLFNFYTTAGDPRYGDSNFLTSQYVKTIKELGKGEKKLGISNGETTKFIMEYNPHVLVNKKIVDKKERKDVSEFKLSKLGNSYYNVLKDYEESNPSYIN